MSGETLLRTIFFIWEKLLIMLPVICHPETSCMHCNDINVLLAWEHIKLLPDSVKILSLIFLVGKPSCLGCECEYRFFFFYYYELISDMFLIFLAPYLRFHWPRKSSFIPTWEIKFSYHRIRTQRIRTTAVISLLSLK